MKEKQKEHKTGGKEPEGTGGGENMYEIKNIFYVLHIKFVCLQRAKVRIQLGLLQIFFVSDLLFLLVMVVVGLFVCFVGFPSVLSVYGGWVW